ncbi:MAG: alpha/beta hydrolase [Pseudoflavonifractor sp.]
MANLREFTYPSADGTHQVHGAEWLPENGAPKAVLQLVHGISEYILRYAPFGEYMADHGFAVVGSDHLGHGKTAKDPSEYGFIAEEGGWNLLLADVRALRTLTGTAYPDLPYFMLGHSMGSFLARTYLIAYPDSLTGCILSGTGQEAPITVTVGKALAGHLAKSKGGKYVSKFLTNLSLGAYNKKFAPNRTGADWISRDLGVVDAYVADPLCQFVPTVGMFRDMMGGLQFISDKKNLAKMEQNTPIYLMSGDKDPVGAMGAGVEQVRGFFAAAGTKDLSMKLYPGGRHEMLNETNRGEVYEDIRAWLEGHI